MPKAPCSKIGAKFKEIKVGTMKNRIERDIMFDVETTIATTTLNGVTIVEKIKVGPIFSFKI